MSTGLWDVQFCCFACHIDHDYYGVPLPSVVFSNGWRIEVCCMCRSQVGKHLARLQSDQSFLWWLRAADLEQLYRDAGRYTHLSGTSSEGEHKRQWLAAQQLLDRVLGYDNDGFIQFEVDLVTADGLAGLSDLVGYVMEACFEGHHFYPKTIYLPRGMWEYWGKVATWSYVPPRQMRQLLSSVLAMIEPPEVPIYLGKDAVLVRIRPGGSEHQHNKAAWSIGRQGAQLI